MPSTYAERLQGEFDEITTGIEGLLERAAAELGLDLGRSYMVGDRWSDLRCGAAVGATTVLVLTGYGRGDLAYVGPGQPVQPDHVAEDLERAAAWILERTRCA